MHAEPRSAGESISSDVAFRSASGEPSFGRRKFFKKLYSQRYLYLMLAPAFILVLVFQYSPLAGWIIAFKDYKLGRSVFDVKWVGLAEFGNFLKDLKDVSGQVVLNTLGMNFIMLSLGLLLPPAIAILLNEMKSKFYKRLVQTVTLFPFFISAVIVYSIFYIFFAPSSGVVNILLMRLGVIDEGIQFLTSPNWSWAVIISVSLWKSLGYSSIIFLAAITAIDQVQYEAAEIDGASRFGKIIHVTLPNLQPTFLVILLLNLGMLFSSDLSLYYLFTNSLNRETMEVLSMYIYRMGLQKLDFSYATASGILLSIINISLVFGGNALSKRFLGRSLY